MFRSLIVALAAAAVSVAGADEGGHGAPLVRAVRAGGELRLDGALDEPDWASAPVFDAFVAVFPVEGGAPGERTELRILYDDRNLYIGFRCHDSQPSLIVRKLGRRDRPPISDSVEVAIDSAHGHRTAYAFGVNAGGVLSDTLLYDDTGVSNDWDAVWDAAVHPLPDGWSAEFVIPLRLLRFSPAAGQTWGFLARRVIARTHEDIISSFIPRSATARVSRFGHLVGIEDLRPRPNVELSPYLAARTSLTPQYSDPAVPEPRLLNPSLDLGLDLKAALTSDLMLNATVNPDFGQVEADELILNLTNAESYFPEKRPFFTQGMELFQPVGGDAAPQRLFYSRRIGLTTPILAAAKLSGTVTPGLDVGVLDALVLGAASDTGDEANPDRRFQFHLVRPLHLGPNNELPRMPPVPQNFLVAVARGKVGEGSTVGGQVALATPLTGTCTADDLTLERQPVSCAAQGGTTAALEWDLRSHGSEWVAQGQLAASQVVGGPPERILRDGTVLSRGTTGLGAYLTAGKMGGEPFRFDLKYRYTSPTFDLNAAGFLPLQNQQALAAGVEYTRPGGLGKLHSFRARLNVEAKGSTDGRQLSRGNQVTLSSRILLPGFQWTGFDIGYTDPGYDIREIGSSGVPFERPDVLYGFAFFDTDENQPLFVSIFGAAGLHAWPSMARGSVGWTADLRIIYRPEDRLETRLIAIVDVTPDGPRWVGDQGAGQPLFGDLTAAYLSIILRQQWVITPTLTLQAYAQLFSNRGAFGSFYSAGAPGGPIRLSSLLPDAAPVDPAFHDSALNLNVVLRWEYRLGSTLYLVYTRAQQEPPRGAGQPLPATILPWELQRGPSIDAFMVKWSYFWSG